MCRSNVEMQHHGAVCSTCGPYLLITKPTAAVTPPSSLLRTFLYQFIHIRITPTFALCQRVRSSRVFRTTRYVWHTKCMQACKDAVAFYSLTPLFGLTLWLLSTTSVALSKLKTNIGSEIERSMSGSYECVSHVIDISLLLFCRYIPVCGGFSLCDHRPNIISLTSS